MEQSLLTTAYLFASVFFILARPEQPGDRQNR